MIHRSPAAIALTAAALVVVFCPPARASTTIGGTVTGTASAYDYAPTVIQNGQTQDFFWCGDGDSRTTDTIFHEQYSFAGGLHITIPQHPSLIEGAAGAWDSLYTCNPDVIEGSFPNPFGDGANYTWLMAYVGTSHQGGVDNSIGIAYSNSGDSWRKLPSPVIAPRVAGQGFYGIGQPNLSYVNGVLTMLYEDDELNATGPIRAQHAEATSADGGRTWTGIGTTTTAGLDDPAATWGGAAYNTQDGRWYAAFNDALRPPGTTGNIIERGQPGVTLYSAGDPLAGTWTRLDTIDAVQTGYEANFLAGVLRGPDGTVYTPMLPAVEIYASTSVPRPAWNATHTDLGDSAQINQWQIAWSTWTPNSPWRALLREAQASGVKQTTTGYLDTSHFHLDNVNLGKLAEAPTGDATVPLYLCKAFSYDWIPTTDPACLGQNKVGLLGYMYAAAAPERIAIYRCTTPQIGDFASADPGCEGQTIDGLLGYSQS